MSDPARIEAVFREAYGRAVAVLVRHFGDVELAEEAVQDAFVVALERWPETGVPPSPAGWIVTTARRRLIDRVRRESSRDDRHLRAALLAASTPNDGEDNALFGDDRLRLLFLCCHPAIAPAAQVALALRLLLGVGTAEIARAFLVPEATLAQRLVRAKQKIRDAHIPYRVPHVDELPARLRGVLAAVYLLYNEGYLASRGAELTRGEHCTEALRLARLVNELLPDEPEVMGLLALLLLAESRRATRTDANGALVPLPLQDRSRWNPALITEGQALVRRCLERARPGPYQLQAAIQAVHSDASTAADTDWQQVVALYDHLLALAPNPLTELHRAVALAERDGPAPARAIVDALPLAEHHLFHAIRADLLRRLGRPDEARRAYAEAATRTDNEREREFLERRAAEMCAKS